MALSKENREFLASTAACIVMAGLVVFACVKLINANRNNRNAEKGKTVAVVDGPENGTSGKDPFAMSDTVRLMPDTVRFGGDVDSLQVEIVKRDGIIAQKDSIIADRDTAIAVLNRELKDCEENKKPAAKKPAQTKKPVAKKPEAKQPEVKKPAAKPVEKKPEVKQPVEKKPVCEPKPVTPVHVEFNDDSHDNVVNVNNGIVINNNYNAVVDTIKAAQKKVQYSVGKAYTGRTVHCQ